MPRPHGITSEEDFELLGEPRMSMAEFQRDEEAQFKECELCETRVHIDLEYLEEKGCVYCQEEVPEDERSRKA